MLDRKLALVLDIDHTLLHAVVSKPGAEYSSEGVVSFSLEGVLYSVKLRPHLSTFLQQVSELYQMFLYTQGTRAYAESIASIIDPEKKTIGGRIVSRTDTPELDGAKSLDRLFLGDTRMVVVVDDREDVWRGLERSQLLLVPPFKFFSEGVDINNAPGVMSSMNGDEDSQLLLLLDALRAIHESYYAQVAEGTDDEGSHKLRTTSEVISMRRSCILRGCTIICLKTEVRSVISQGLIELAQSMGAKIAEKSGDHVTHLLCLVNPSTSQDFEVKIYDDSTQNSICLVNPEWLKSCHRAMSRVDISPFIYGFIDSDCPKNIMSGVKLKQSSHVLQDKREERPASEVDEEGDDDNSFVLELDAGFEDFKRAQINP